MCIRDRYTMRVNKQALSPYDDKRYILDNGRDTLAYGHYRIRRINMENDDDDTSPPAKKFVSMYSTCLLYTSRCV